MSEDKKKSMQWRHVQALIAGMEASPTQKCLLIVIHCHAQRKGFACASMETLAREIGASLRTTRRTVQLARQRGVVTVEGTDRYWLNIERLKELQRRAAVQP
jgi:hypothetical protein